MKLHDVNNALHFFHTGRHPQCYSSIALTKDSLIILQMHHYLDKY